MKLERLVISCGGTGGHFYPGLSTARVFRNGGGEVLPSSNYCFLTRIQISQEAGQVVWYSHLFQNFSQFIEIHTVKGFGIVNKAEIDVFLELSCFFDDPVNYA